MTQHAQQPTTRTPDGMIYAARTRVGGGNGNGVSRGSEGQFDVELPLSGSSRTTNSERHAATGWPVVFIVDNDGSVRKTLGALLCEAGWQPETFASAEEFLSRPRASCPSCLVLDLTLPDLGALDLQQRLATERADMPIIFISGLSDVPAAIAAWRNIWECRQWP
ncbi:MAG TPA: response regulator [Stellaceae bacterium]|nr:response regulator [Stellaceae bacterium]